MKLPKVTAFVIVLVLIGTSITLSETHELTPENTVIVSNETDRDFCQDFSVFLQRASLEWVYTKQSKIPDNVKDKNVIIVGGPDAIYTGEVVKDILTQNEIDLIRRDRTYCTFVKDSPWAENRVIYVCAGSDRVYTERAAEEGIKSIIRNTEDLKWMDNPLTEWSYEEAQKYISHYQFIPDSKELSTDNLTIELTYEYNPYISSENAKEDVEHLFYLLSHGYCGYGYYKTKGNFEQAKKNILQELETSSTWSLHDLSELIYTHLQFIRDAHLRIGYNNYYSHKDFWHSRNVEIWKTEGEYYFFSDNKTLKILQVNNNDPEGFIYPSLNPKGDPMYILGVLSLSPPGPLTLTVENENETRLCEIRLYRSSSESMLGPGLTIFETKETSGIPIIRVSSFSDGARTELESFLRTAERYKDEPYLILDIRGNGGGNSNWPEKWVEQFTGHNPEWYFTATTLKSRTALMGRINQCRYYLNKSPQDMEIKTHLQECEEELRIFEESHRNPYWSELYNPDIQLIPNDTTLIVLTDGNVASSGEAFIGMLRLVENVVFLGENSAGGCMFGYITLHQLPHSHLSIRLTTRLYYPLDLQFIEGKGFSPHLWVPASDALNYVVAAIEKGVL